MVDALRQDGFEEIYIAEVTREGGVSRTAGIALL